MERDTVSSIGNSAKLISTCTISLVVRMSFLLTSLLATGFSTSETCVSFVKSLSGTRSASSLTLFCVKTSVLSLGMLFAKLGWMLATRFRAHKSVCSRSICGKFASVAMSLSVKSMHSWSFATPRFSMAGILCPSQIYV